MFTWDTLTRSSKGRVLVAITRTSPVTIVTTDFVGSTEVYENLTDEDAFLLQKRYLAAQRDALRRFRGREVKNMGDGLMIVFRSAVDAVACAVAMQVANEELNSRASEVERLRMKIGMNSGEAIRDGRDYFGEAVSIAYRLTGSARPGQILVSSVVRNLVGTRGGHTFRGVGQLALRGFRDPVDAFEVLWQSSGEQGQRNTGRSDAEAADQVVKAVAPPEAPQVMVAILFLDVVDSTALTERLGDQEFREKTRQLDGRLRELIRRSDGSAMEGKVLGDGIMAIFPSARHAVGCAIQVNSEAAAVGLELHTGIHAGDVIRESQNVYGGAVNIASRIQGLSAPGQILVSDVIRGLARTSTDVEFTDLGEHELRGVSDPIRLYEIRAS